MGDVTSNDLKRINAAVGQIEDAARVVHNALGPEKREMNYEFALVHELVSRGLDVERMVPVTSVRAGDTIIADMVVEGCVAVQLYAVEPVTPAHTNQLKKLINAGGYAAGVLLNFSVSEMDDDLALRV